MRKVSILLIILFPSTFVFSQTEIFIPYRKGDVWGFADTNMQMRINPQYTKVDMFHEGLAPVWNGKTCTYIHQDGKQITNEKFDNCFEFRNGFARVDRGNNYAVINRRGEVITPFKYNAQQPRKPSPGDDMPFLMDSLTGIVLLEGFDILIDTNGKELTKLKYRNIFSFGEQGLAGVWSPDPNNHNNGLINRKGELVVPFVYDNIDYFTDEDLIYVKNDGKYGYLNPEGKLAIDLKYEAAEPFQDGRAIVKLNGKYGMINTQDMFTIDPVYDEIIDMYDGYYILRRGNMHTVMNPNKLLDFKYEMPVESWSLNRISTSGYYYVYAHNKIYFLNPEGLDIHHEYYLPSDAERDSAGYDPYGGGSYFKYIDFIYVPGYDDMFLSYQNKKMAVVDEKGTLITFYKYDQLDVYWSDMCRFRIGKKYGYLDRNGEEISSGFDLNYPFYGEFAMVVKNDLYGYINRKGEQIIPCIYEDGDYWFEDGMIKVIYKGKEGYVDKNGRQFFSE